MLPLSRLAPSAARQLQLLPRQSPRLAPLLTRAMHMSRTSKAESTSTQESTSHSAKEAEAETVQVSQPPRQADAQTSRSRRGGGGRARREPSYEVFDPRREFDSFRNSINSLMRDFDQSMGGLLGGDSLLGLGRGRGDRGFFGPSMLPSSLLDFGGERGPQRMLGRSAGDMGREESALMPRGMEEDIGESALTPLSDLMLATPLASIRLDVEELSDKYRVSAEVPGLKPKDLKVNVEGNVLTIEGRHREEKREEDKNKRFLRVERHSGLVRRALRLPDDVDASQVGARYDAGVLKIDLPKRHEMEHPQGNIKILTGEEASAGETAGTDTKAAKKDK